MIKTSYRLKNITNMKKAIKWIFTFPWNDDFKGEYVHTHAFVWAVIVSIPLIYFILH
jgi:hypothetical protein